MRSGKEFEKNPLMNNTKWDELRSLPCNTEGQIEWRFKKISTKEISLWVSGTSLIEVANCKWSEIEWLEIKFHGNKESILADLRKIHVPGIVEAESVKIYGYYDGYIEYL